MDSKGVLVVSKSSETFYYHPTRKRYDHSTRKCKNFFILIRSSLSIISFRKTFICHPLRVFEMLSQNSYLNATSLTIKRHTIRIFTIYAFKNANSKDTPLTKSMEKLRSQSTFLVVLSSPLQDTLILKIDRLKCSSPFTRRFSLG